uniref:Uncharacterized protein n=1 Tax=Mycobacterium avium subsp. hominissuis TaxID=439334 RepID=A0A187NDR0_MYCAV|nr:hypothetical protein MASH_00016 [Mycobacterium avium subsp. hominissuis]
MGAVHPPAPAVCYSDKHLARAELDAAFRAPWGTWFLPPAPGPPKSHLRDGSAPLKSKRLRRC